jgi:hypothetical protein
MATSDGDLVQPRALLLRAIERLRAGLPPATAALRLSVGTERLASTLGGFLDTPGNRGMFVIGDYGTGKSHSLTLLRDFSHERGYASCWLTADGFECALNHPQRFISYLLATLETPAGDAGYSAFIGRMLATPELRHRLVAKVSNVLDGGSHLELAVQGLLRELMVSTRHSGAAEIVQIQADALARLVSGELLTGLSGLENYRRVAYRLIRLAADLVVLDGNHGVLLILDEVESVFTKLGNVRSRFGAYRVLSALCHGLEGAQVKVAMAITPDAEYRLKAELGYDSDYLVAPPFEPVRTFRAALLDEAIPSLRCRALSAPQLDELLWRIRSLYSEAYPEGPHGSNRDWQRTVRAILQWKPPVRIAVRDGIDALDRSRLLCD